MTEETKIPQEISQRVFELTLALYRVTDFFPSGEVLRRQLREKANEIFGGLTEYDFSREKEASLALLLSKLRVLKGYLGIAREMRLVRPINLAVLEREYDALSRFFEEKLELARHEALYEKETVVKASQSSRREKEGGLTAHNNTGAELLSREANPVRELAQDMRPRVRMGEGYSAASSEAFSNGAKRERRYSNFDQSLVRSQVVTVDPSASFIINERQRKILEYLKKNTRGQVSDFSSFFRGISSKTVQRDLRELVERDLLKKEGDRRWTFYSAN